MLNDEATPTRSSGCGGLEEVIVLLPSNFQPLQAARIHRRNVRIIESENVMYEGTLHGNAKLAYSEVIPILNPISFFL